jgi:hypothetical protein
MHSTCSPLTCTKAMAYQHGKNTICMQGNLHSHASSHQQKVLSTAVQRGASTGSYQQHHNNKVHTQAQCEYTTTDITTDL